MLMCRSACNIATFVALNLLIARLGPTAMAASELGKQGWILSAQSFSALDVANQALTASYLGVVRASAFAC
jgi:Na+-driven multidrug efflux pump